MPPSLSGQRAGGRGTSRGSCGPSGRSRRRGGRAGCGSRRGRTGEPPRLGVVSATGGWFRTSGTLVPERE
ncbi:hypothetical protein F8R89_15605 [Streptomyces sp. SS1-1]|nr:hypothetical protein F8R89_15605 [Streptomyces sp. SS1-1]